MEPYICASDLSKYFSYVEAERPIEYIVSMLILYGGFTLSECVKLTPDDLSGKCIVNDRIGRVLVYSDHFREYCGFYITSLPVGAPLFNRAGEALSQQNISVLIRRAFKHVGINGGTKQLLNTFYFRYLVNCGSFDALPVPNHYKIGWMESRVGISTAMYKNYKDDFLNTKLPDDFIDLASAFFKYALQEPALNDKCHKIYSLMSDCVSIMSDSHPL